MRLSGSAVSKSPRSGWLLIVSVQCMLIALGGIGACCGLALIDGYHGPLWPGPNAPPGLASLQSFVDRWIWAFLILDLMGLTASVLLATAGAGLLFRQLWGLQLLIAAALVSSINAVGSAVIVASATAAQLSSVPPGAGGDVRTFAIWGIGIAFCWRMIIPCTVILMMNSETVRGEIDGWRGVTCESCGYDMRGTLCRCPECGRSPRTSSSSGTRSNRGSSTGGKG